MQERHDAEVAKMQAKRQGITNIFKGYFLFLIIVIAFIIISGKIAHKKISRNRNLRRNNSYRRGYSGSSYDYDNNSQLQHQMFMQQQEMIRQQNEIIDNTNQIISDTNTQLENLRNFTDESTKFNNDCLAP